MDNSIARRTMKEIVKRHGKPFEPSLGQRRFAVGANDPIWLECVFEMNPQDRIRRRFYV